MNRHDTHRKTRDSPARRNPAALALPALNFAALNFAALNFAAISFAMLALSACGSEDPAKRLDRQAETYVRLAMALDGQNPDSQRQPEVDSWFGPAHLKTSGRSAAPPLAEVLTTAQTLQSELSAAASPREGRLVRRLDELLAVLEFLTSDAPMTFPAEAEALYGVSWREPDPETFVALRAALDNALPGRGTLRARLGSLRQRLIVPAERRLAVFERALEECRRRTLEHWSLPQSEHMEIVTTRDVDSAWHVYHGESQSTLLLNELALGTVDRAVDVACHEGYPGHHAQFVLFEAAAGETGLPLEDQLVLLRSPAAALREGAAMYGVELVFPAGERLAFERDILFPLAGIDPALAPVVAEVRPLLNDLEAVVPAVIRDHEDNQQSDSQAILRLQTEALVSSPQQLFAFAHDVGAYIAGYTMVKQALREKLTDQPLTDPAATPWLTLRRWLERPDDWIDAGWSHKG